MPGDPCVPPPLWQMTGPLGGPSYAQPLQLRWAYAPFFDRLHPYLGPVLQALSADGVWRTVPMVEISRDELAIEINGRVEVPLPTV